MKTEEISRLFVYTEWANHTILDAVAGLSAEELRRETGVSHSSLFGTLVHMLGAEWIWLERWKGNNPSALPGEAEFADLNAVRERWHEIEGERQKLLAGLTDEMLNGQIGFSDTRGNHYSFPLGELMQHVVNHATHHRGQITAMIRQLGIQPPTTDLIHYLRNR